MLRSPALPLPTLLARRQRGAVLVTGLIFMLLATLLTLAMLRVTLQEDRMAVNSRNQQLALQAAEAVLSDAETAVFRAAPFWPYSAVFRDDCTDGLCTPATGSTPRWKTVDWTSSTATRSFATATPALDGVPVQPRYIVELVGMPPTADPALGCTSALLRLTARGVGPGNAVAFVQTMYRLRPDVC